MMAKSRSFSIFLLKDGFNAQNSLKEDHMLKECRKASNLPNGSVLYLSDKRPADPWWKTYWGISQDLKQTLKGAIVFIPVSNRCFAITFGHTYHNLKENSYEYDFGLRTTLNALDPKKIKSTDILQPEKARRERIQSPTSSDLTFFDINHDESIIKRLTGAVADEYKDILTNITGASSLRISSKVGPEKIPDLCKRLLEIYQKNDYKNNFPDVQSITPVKDPAIVEKLNKQLLAAFNDDAVELVLSVPDIIDHATSFRVKYSGAGRTDKSYDDVYISHYREYLNDRQQANDVTINTFKRHQLNIQDENGQTRESYSVFKCFLFDCDLDSLHYHLCEGEWYCVDGDYLEKIKNSIDSSFAEYDILNECNDKLENYYNNTIAKNHSDVICLDKKNIAPDGQTQVEPCDLLRKKDDHIHLIHIKISTRSAALSHLFNQGLNSVELLRLHQESRKKLNKLTNKKYSNLVEKGTFVVVYGIVTAKKADRKSDNLPLFSRISLKRTLERLKLMGIQARVVFIKDNVDRKKQQTRP